MDEPALHPDVAPIAFLIGTWRGEGSGTYPTIEPFAFGEEIRFTNVGKPVLAYEQRTWHPVKGFTMHVETGYWRQQPDGRIEIVLVHPTGIAEIQEGTIDGARIDVHTTTVARTSTAKQVDALERTFEVDGDVLRYEVRMAAVGVPLTSHLTAELKRVD
jgi:hypothetical protein